MSAVPMSWYLLLSAALALWWWGDAMAILFVPPVLIKPIAKPGTYQVRLTVDGESQTQSFELKMNPNEEYTPKDSAARFELWLRLRSIFERSNKEISAAMAEAAKVYPGVSCYKLKVAGEPKVDAERVRAVAAARPGIRAISAATGACRPASRRTTPIPWSSKPSPWTSPCAHCSAASMTPAPNPFS